MTTCSFVKRLTSVLQALALTASLMAPMAAKAANDDVLLELRPHCDAEDVETENVFGGSVPVIDGIMTPTDGTCYSYPVKDPTSRQTGVLEEGDELDMDLVIVNPDRKAISRVSGWIAYDPTILKGEDIEISSVFGIPTPGESDFDEDNAVIKIGASTANPAKSAVIKVARIKMKVVDVPANQTVLSFDDISSSTDSKVAVISGEGAQETNLLPSTLGSLVVRLAAKAEASSSAKSSKAAQQASSIMVSSQTVVVPPASISSSSVATQESSSSSTMSSTASVASSVTSVPSNTSFTLLQVQNLRATTEGSSVFLAWDALESSDLRGYNVYYGTTSGKYIQRRSVDSSTTNLTLRGLVENTRYYFAVRAVNSKNQESQFSREVGITIGKPETSTNPLAASAVTDKGPMGSPPKNDGNISGESGPTSVWLIVLGACATIGTVLAFKRQFIAHS